MMVTAFCHKVTTVDHMGKDFSLKLTINVAVVTQI